MSKIMNLYFDAVDAVITDVKEVNSSFATASLKVMYTGSNRNTSNIERKVVEDALPTLYNVPIVANWDPMARTIGGHDMTVFKDADGNLRIRNETVPLGVITDHTNFSFVKEKDENGVEHEYLKADGVVLWKRQDVYEYIVNDLNGRIAHSMEIDVTSGGKNEETGYYDVTSFEFTALCLLGEGHTPCFEGSELQVYSNQSIKSEIATMMSELKECYSLIAPADNAVDNTTKTTMEGGERMHDEKLKLMEEYGLSEDSLDFEIDSLTVDELRAKFEEMKATTEADASTEDSAAEPETEAEPATDGKPAENYDLNSNVRDALREALCAEVIHRDWGDMARYFMVDYDAEKSEVYVDSCEDWGLYGFKFNMDGDKAVIDWESKTRKKYQIVDFDEGGMATMTTAGAVFSAMAPVIESATNEKNDASEKFNEMSTKYAEFEAELNSLREFKAQAESAERTEKANAVFAQFSDLSGNETFEALRSAVEEDSAKYDAETLEEKCFAIRGRIGTAANFSLEKSAPKIKVEKDNDDAPMPYGGIVEKYLGN